MTPWNSHSDQRGGRRSIPPSLLHLQISHKLFLEIHFVSFVLHTNFITLKMASHEPPRMGEEPTLPQERGGGDGVVPPLVHPRQGLECMGWVGECDDVDEDVLWD